MRADRKLISNSIIALIIFMLFLFLGLKPYLDLRVPKNTEYDMVVFGDSIMGEYRDEDSIINRMSEKMDIKIFNSAFGGT